MRITTRGTCLGVSKKFSDVGEWHAARNEVARAGMPNIVNSEAFEIGSFAQIGPLVTQILERLSWNARRREKKALALFHPLEHSDGARAERNVFDPLLFRVGRGLRPYLGFQVELLPPSL